MCCFVVIDRLVVFANIGGEGVALSNYSPAPNLVIFELAKAG